MAYQSKMVGEAERFLWNNWKFYLMTYPTCLMDTILEVVDPDSTNPYTRYKDFANELEAHMGLGSYVTGQAAQYSRIPYITVNFQAIPMGGCSTRVVCGFDIAYATDTPKAPNNDLTRDVGSSGESVADFRADIMMGLDEMFYYAFDEAEHHNELYSQAFFDRLYKKEVVNPTNPNEKKKWLYNVKGLVDDDSTISAVTQLKREDRSIQLNLFHVVYKMDLNELSTENWECGC